MPILVSYLLDGKDLAVASKPSRELHDCALETLMKIGPRYPEQFRTVMSTSVDLKPKLEAAVKIDQAAKARLKSKPVTKAVAEPSKPTITLKTDFSNFTG